MTRIALSIAAASMLVLNVTACAEKKPPEAPQTTAGEPQPSSAFTVGDTFGTLRAIHTAEVEHGTLAEQKATDPKVKSFAEKVVKDHRARMAKDDRIMSAIGIAPRDSSVSQQIASASAQQTERLNALSGADFDRAYIEEQINYYRTALDVFDRELLPNTRDPQIRSNIMEARSKANEHLKEAQDLRLQLINR